MMLIELPQPNGLNPSVMARVVGNSFEGRLPSSRQKSVYKFTKHQFMDDFFATGSLKIGTLIDFQNTEKHGMSIGDGSEGRHRVLQYVKRTRDVEPDSYLSTFFPPGRGVSITGCTFIQRRESPDAFLFCTAATCNNDLFAEWNKRDQYDACYEIFDMSSFLQVITTKIASSVSEFAAFYPTYINGDISFQSELRHVHPATLKQQTHEWQREFRAIWMPKGPLMRVEPMIIHVPEAVQYCRKLASWESGQVRYL